MLAKDIYGIGFATADQIAQRVGIPRDSLNRARAGYVKSDMEGIKRYTHDWIEHGGRVAIWTRDMSWAQNADTRRLLRDKAVRGELILCLPEENELARELAVAGAEVCAYGANHLDAPASRFTTA